MTDELKECPFCHSKNLTNESFLSGDPYYRCKDCGETFFLSSIGKIMRFDSKETKWVSTNAIVKEKVKFT